VVVSLKKCERDYELDDIRAKRLQLGMHNGKRLARGEREMLHPISLSILRYHDFNMMLSFPVSIVHDGKWG
jgi:hypothetical protein